jgi:transcriptional regulator with XRE-family HTH domain
MLTIGGVHMDYERTGLLISNLRKEKGLTQKELADKLGITDRAVSKWERGLGSPDISLLDDLSRILDISILEILKGRKLDKDEIFNNENIIESMNYSKESFKHKLKKYFNTICISIILIISLILIVNNLKSIYYLNKIYRNDFFDNSEQQLFSEINENIEKIKSDKGVYSDEEYKKILNFINKLENNLKKENNLYYYNKKQYKYSEIVEFYDCHKESWNIEATAGHIQEIYEIVHNHNPNVVKNIVSYYTYTNSLIDDSVELFEQLKAPYYNGKKIDREITVSIQSFIYFENYRDDMLLKDIVEVGGIDE